VRDLDLAAVVGVGLHQHPQPALVAPPGDLTDEPERFRRHEARQARRLDGIAHRIQPHLGDPCGGQLVQDAEQVVPGELLPDVDVDLLRGERGPDQALAAVGESIDGERQPRPRPVQAHQIILPGTPGEDRSEGEEHPVAGRSRALGKPVGELRGRAGNVIDDEVGRDRVPVPRQSRDVIPGAKPRIDLRVIPRIESRVRAVEWQVEGQDVHPSEQARQRARQDSPQPAQVTSQPGRVRDQFHRSGHVPPLAGRAEGISGRAAGMPGGHPRRA